MGVRWPHAEDALSWSAIIGGRKTNKPQAALAVARVLEARGLRVGGFVQREVLDDAGEPAGWDVQRLDGTARRPLARTSKTPDLCDFSFDELGFAQAAAWAKEPCDVVVVGGIGKLEADQKGHFPVLERLASSPGGPHVLACVRDSCLTTVGLLLPDATNWVELPCDDTALTAFAEELADAVSQHS